MPSKDGSQDRFDVSATSRAPAAVEWRTIPPTINVRYKRRPPPLTLLSRRSSDLSSFSPGPLDTSTPISSLSSAFTAATSPPSANFKWPAEFTLKPVHSRADGLPVELPVNLSTWRSGVASATENSATVDPPENPERYLLDHPWSFTEYLHLLSFTTTLRPQTRADWLNVTAAYNASDVPKQRTPWDCWHRAAVPWNTATVDDSLKDLVFPDVPGVQHPYHFVDISALVDVYLTVASVLGPADSIPTPTFEPSIASKIRPTRAHPSYPSPGEPPNVPPRTLGDLAHRGILPWFRATAVNATVLSNPRAEHANLANDLPPHLRALRVPPPPYARRGHG